MFHGSKLFKVRRNKREFGYKNEDFFKTEKRDESLAALSSMFNILKITASLWLTSSAKLLVLRRLMALPQRYLRSAAKQNHFLLHHLFRGL